MCCAFSAHPLEKMISFFQELPAHHLTCHLYKLRIYLSCLLHPCQQTVRIAGYFLWRIREKVLNKCLWIPETLRQLLRSLKNAVKCPNRPVHLRNGRLHVLNHRERICPQNLLNMRLHARHSSLALLRLVPDMLRPLIVSISSCFIRSISSFRTYSFMSGEGIPLCMGFALLCSSSV